MNASFNYLFVLLSTEILLASTAQEKLLLQICRVHEVIAPEYPQLNLTQTTLHLLHSSS